MQRASFRVFSAFVAAWLAFVLAEPAALHVCPAHDALPQSTVSSAAHSHATAGHDHAAGGHAAESSDTHADAPDTHQCACLGHCVSSSAAGPAPVAIAAVGVLQLAGAAIPPVEARFSPPGHEFLLPFANGPPLSA